MRYFKMVTGIYPLSLFRSTYQMPLNRGERGALGSAIDPFYFNERIVTLPVKICPCQVRIVIIFI
jgi:hypothetical protein